MNVEKALDEELERDVIQPNPSYALRAPTPPPELSDDDSSDADAEPEKPQQQMVGIPARAMQMSYIKFYEKQKFWRR